MLKNKTKKQSGITLVALVVTLIILLILAGVAMSLITGEGGLFARVNHAGVVYNTSAHNEADRYAELDTYATQYGGDEKSDLEKLREAFAGGFEEFATKEIASEVEIFGSNVQFIGFTYKGKKYAVDSYTMLVYECVADLDSVDLSTFGEYVDENLNSMLVTPSTSMNNKHNNYFLSTSEEVYNVTNVELEGVDYVYVASDLDEHLRFYDINTGEFLGAYGGIAK